MIEDVVRQYVPLKQAGRNFKGLCPFHQEKTPSFVVSPEKQLAYCFGCHKGGDIFAFIQEIEGVDFKESIKLLAEKANIDMSEYNSISKPQHSKSERDELYDIHKKSLSFYTNLLWESDKGKKVLEYLRLRGLEDETIRKFEFGYAPDSFDETHMMLVKAGFSRKMIALSGMAVAKDTEHSKVYDRFRGRLIIPIYDSVGRIVGFGGRALKKGDNPKYLNSPDSPIYKKGEVLYGFNFAKNSIKNNNSAILVEGYFDVVMAVQAGTGNVVATSGTALTSKQIKLLKRFTKDLTFCFDTDSAGVEAAKRGFEIAQNEDVNVHICVLSNAKDPADYIKESTNNWLEVIKNTIPFMQFCINEALNKYDRKTLEGKKKILSEILSFLSKVKNAIDKDFYIREIAQKLDIKEVQIYDEMKRQRKNLPSSKNTIKKNIKSSSKKFDTIELIFGLLLEYNEILDGYIDLIDVEYLPEDKKSIYNTYKDNYNLLRAGKSREAFLSCFEPEVRKRIELTSLYIEETYSKFNDEMLKNEFKALVDSFRMITNERLKRNLTNEIREAEKKGNNTYARELLEKLKTILSS